MKIFWKVSSKIEKMVSNFFTAIGANKIAF